MNCRHISLLFISLICCVAAGAQETDSLLFRETYGLRLGVDLVKPVRTALDEDYRGFQINGDFRIYEDYYLAGELGNEQNLMAQENVTALGRGSYLKLGANYNVYDNWTGMQNLVYVGLRYGFASFTTELLEYSIYNTNPYFEPDLRTENVEYSNLTASWAEFQLGIKVEVLENFYLGTHVALKRRITQTRPGGFDNLYIPGFGRTYDNSTYGVGFGYSMAYLIPFYKK